MQVETYECSETAAEPIEACEEAIRLMGELGLEGQQQLVAPPDDEQPARRVPYREMTAEERFVFKVLCPKETELTQYRLGPIPLRVLQVAAHASELGCYKHLQVWHIHEQVVQDPVLVGVMQVGSSSWETKDHLLARWGEELESWPTLVKRAVEKKRAQVRDIYGTLLRKLQVIAAADDLPADELIRNGPDWKPYLNT